MYYWCYIRTFASSFKESELSTASLTTGTSWGIVNTALALECSSCRESSPENVTFFSKHIKLDLGPCEQLFPNNMEKYQYI